MSTIGTGNLNLADYGKRLDPDGKIASITELLSETNPILQDMAWIEGNLPTGHRTTVRTGLPTVAWRLLNYGVASSKSRTMPVTDTIGMLESYGKVDKDLALLNGNTAEFRLSEDRPFIESMNQTMSSTIFYGNTASNPERFLGLAPRYSSLSADNAGNIINGAGAGNTNASIWLVGWGNNTCHGIFPKGSKAGLMAEDLGQDTLTDAAGGEFQGFRTHYQWKAGLALRDWRYVVRIANIDVALLKKDAASGADLVDLMQQAMETIQDMNLGKPIFYMNRTLRSFLRRQVANRGNVNFIFENVAGKMVDKFDGIPVRMSDSLLSTEATVVA